YITGVGELLTAGSPSLNVNVTVIFTKGATQYPLMLSSQNPQQYLNNLLDAQIYGYLPGALNTYLGTSSPSVLQLFNNKGYQVIPATSPSSIQSISMLGVAGTFPVAWTQSAGVAPSGITLPIYTYGILQTGITQQNQAVSGVLTQTIAPGSAFSGINYNKYTSSAIINVLNNPIYYPQLQFLANVTTLGLYIPVASPTITSVNPNPVKGQGAVPAPATFIVYNNASTSAGAYIVVNIGGVTTQSPNYNVPSHGSASFPMNLNLPSNLGTSPVSYNATATVYASQMNSVYSIYPFIVIVAPNAGPSTSTSVTTTAPPCANLNASGQCPPPTSSSIPLWIIAIIVLIILAFIFGGGLKTKGGGYVTSAGVVKRPVGRPPGSGSNQQIGQ
ncbi:MAG: hypothetical protein KGH62_05345, partial [Candidatus Micrarchaeota archaeon]|nr:hypothetical protein [Candidatus Micrarchaeota archaeon]